MSGRSDAGSFALARDFAPDLLTLQESPPSRLPRVVVAGVASVLAGLLAWAAWAQLDVVAAAPGRLVPLTFTKVVQPAEPGVVSQVLVRDGDSVQAGQVLLRLDARVSQADTRTLEQEIELHRLGIARLDAERTGVPLRLPAGATPLVAAQVQAQWLARRGAYDDQRAQEQAALARIEGELAAARQHLARLHAVTPIVRVAADSHEELAREGFVSSLAAAERRREALDKSGELQAQAETVRSLEAARVQQQRKLGGVQSAWRAQLEAERLEHLSQLQRLAREQDKGQVRAGQLEIRAPADGVVKDLAVASPGTVVQAGALLMNLVPRDEPLQAEVSLGNEDVGFVAVGQAVRLKLATYPFQRHGLLEGTVSHVAADANPLPGGQPGAPVYRALVRLARQSLPQGDGTALPLAAGMAVVAEIHQGERSVVEYLLSPVRKVAAEAARER